MALYAIGDLHLSLGDPGKRMDVFGGPWLGYTDKIKAGFSGLRDGDVTVLCGDLSWGMDLKGSLEDFRFINELPGKKLLLKGNHDYWWTTARKMKNFFAENNLSTLDILFNNSYNYGSTALCGTRGWFYEEDNGSHSRKVFERELGRLENSLSSISGEIRDIICFLHYPPVCAGYTCAEIIDILEKHGVKSCVYAHLHGAGHKSAIQGLYRGISFSLASADYIGFKPVKILD